MFAKQVLRLIWISKSASVLIVASGISIPIFNYLRQVSIYGKLRDKKKNDQECNDILGSFSIQSRVAWTSFYVWGATSNLIWMGHLLRRVFESFYLTKFSPLAVVHPLNVLLGIIFYSVLPPSFALDGTASIGHNQRSLTSMAADSIALLLFLSGCSAQHLAHRELASLRRQWSPDINPSACSHYHLPNGWLFRRVSCCPHYTAEVAIYAGLALAGRSASGALACLFTLVNLSLTAVRTRRWYAERFGEAAMGGRRAILPGLL